MNAESFFMSVRIVNGENSHTKSSYKLHFFLFNLLFINPTPMNLKICLAICFFYSSKILMAQLAPVGTTWNYVLWTPVNVREARNIKITIQKDTLIQGKVYSKLFSSFDFLEESYKTIENGKVYYFARDGHHLLFDFNANMGDTIIIERPDPNNIDSIYPLSIRIDSIYYEKDIKQDSLKIYNISNISTIAPNYVEKTIVYERLFIGKNLTSEHNTIFRNDIFPFNIEASTTSFYCYREPNGFSFLLIDSAECDIVDIKEVSELQNQISLYPNPVQKKLFIQNETRYSIQHIEFYDISGKQISKSKPTDLNEIGTDFLPNGDYWMIIEFTNHYRIIKKIVVADR